MKYFLMICFYLTTLNFFCQDTLYYSNGKIKQIGNQQNGKCEFYDENGIPILKGNYLNGRENGKQKYFGLNGKIASEVYMFNGKQIGEYIGYHDDGSISGRYTLDSNGVLLGQAYAYYKSGKIEYNRYINNGIEVKTYYYENGQLMTQDTSINGESNGISVFYWKNGNLRHIVKSYKLGKIEGDFIRFNEDGIMIRKETRIKNSVNLSTYYENGMLESKSLETTNSYNNYVIEYTEYYQNGNMSNTCVMVDFKDGRHEENCLYFNVEGKNISKKTFDKINKTNIKTNP